MNFEEMLNQKAGRSAMSQPMFFGRLVKWKADDGKFVNVVELKRELADATGFSKALENEAEKNNQLKHKLQLHFDIATNADGITGVRLGQGNYSTVDQLITINPAAVASKNFCRDMVKGLISITDYLNSQGIYHVCYSPDNILVKRNSNDPLLLLHASEYTNAIYDNKLLWKGHEQYVAPEVLNGDKPTEASEVYSIGRFIEYLYSSSAVPLEWRNIVKKATKEAPDDRYATASDMLAAMKQRRNIGRALLIAAAAVILALIVTLGLNTFSSKTYEMDYIAPVAQENDDSLLDKGFDEEMEMALIGKTTVDSGAAPGKLPPKVEQDMREQREKAEDIFRRQYTKQAERILSRLYSKSRLTMSQQDFMALNATVTDELVKSQQQLAEMTGLSSARSQLLASQIIDQVTNKYEAAQRRQAKQEEEALRSQIQKQQQSDAVTRTIHETVNPDKKENPERQRTKINQRRAYELEEELKEMR